MAFAGHWHWTPREVDCLWLDEFWSFLLLFEEWEKENKKQRKKNRSKSKFHPEDSDPTGWIRDEKFKG